MTKTQTIPWQPFGPKHKTYIKAALGNRMCVAEGAIRSGKTIDHCIIAAMYLETCPDRIHLASGSTMPNAKLNIGDCNGYGLEHIFRGRCRWGKHKDNDALFIDTQTGEKILIFAGGGKADSYKRILGNSYGLWIATEINEHYDSEDSRTSFIKVANGRQTAAVCPLTLWDLNPCHPEHPIYTQYIDKYMETGLVRGYLYQHFVITDNLSVSEERRATIESQYDRESVWYKRDILGRRVMAVGLIYGSFAGAPEKYLTQNPEYDFIQVGVDFGGSKSAFAFVAVGLKRDCSTLTALCSERHPAKDVTPERMYSLFGRFAERVRGKYGKIGDVFCDSAEQTLINGLRSHSDLPIRNSLKKPILDRVRAAVALIGGGRFWYTEDCNTLRDALCNAVYDEDELHDERLDDGTSDIDTLDAFEYAWERYITHYMRYGALKAG